MLRILSLLLSLAGPCLATPLYCNSTRETQPATAGPFYVTNTPHLTTIAGPQFQSGGHAIRVAGGVYDETGTAIARAVVEVWHADPEGAYHPQAGGHYDDFANKEDVDLRGTLVASANGDFAMSSVKAGLYPGRRRHIHWRFSAPGYRNVTTQTYWLDEQGSAQDLADRVDRNAEPCRWLNFVTDPDGASVARFDAFLVAVDAPTTSTASQATARPSPAPASATTTPADRSLSTSPSRTTSSTNTDTDADLPTMVDEPAPSSAAAATTIALVVLSLAAVLALLGGAVVVGNRRARQSQPDVVRTSSGASRGRRRRSSHR